MASFRCHAEDVDLSGSGHRNGRGFMVAFRGFGNGDFDYGGTGFDRDTAVTGSGLTAEYSARYWANQAANSAQDFVDVYYGSFTSDTAAEDYQINDNQGSVNVGDLYFNSTNNVMRVRSFSGWNDVAADTTNFATNGFAIAMAIAL